MNITHVYIHKFTHLFLMSISGKNPKSRSREPCIQASSRAYPGKPLDPSIQEIEVWAVSHSPFLRTMHPKFRQIVTQERHIEISRTPHQGVLARISQCAVSSKDQGNRSPTRDLFLLRKYHVFEVWSKITHGVTPMLRHTRPHRPARPDGRPVASIPTRPGQDPMPVHFILK